MRSAEIFNYSTSVVSILANGAMIDVLRGFLALKWFYSDLNELCENAHSLKPILEKLLGHKICILCY